MAIYPAAELYILPENETQDPINPQQVIIHTAVDADGPSNIPGWFARKDIVEESHFWLPNTGPIVQMIDTQIEADANVSANRRAISIETEDDHDPEGNPWTPEQIGRLVAVLQWCNQTHGIPLEFCQRHDAPGVGWHSMFGFTDPIAQTGPIDNPWSNHLGKTCPGKTRIAQLINVVLPAAAGAAPMMRVLSADMGAAILSSFRRDVADLYTKHRDMTNPTVAARVASDIEAWVEALRLKGGYRDHLDYIAHALANERN